MPSHAGLVRFFGISLLIHLVLVVFVGRRVEPAVWRHPSIIRATLQPESNSGYSERSASSRKVFHPDSRVTVGEDVLQSAAQYASAVAVPAISLPGLTDEDTFFRIHELDRAASPLQPLAFEFPGLPSQPGEIAVVVVELRIDRTGNVAAAELVSALPKGTPFAEITLNGLKRAKFQPAVRRGEPVNSLKLVEVVFEKDGGRRLDKQIIGGDSVDLASQWVVAQGLTQPGQESSTRVTTKGSVPIPAAKEK